MENKLLNDDELNIVSGGVLLEGWDNTLLTIMRLYKGKYGEEGKQMVKDLMVVGLNDPEAVIEAQDMDTLYKFIDDNWDSVEATVLPGLAKARP